MTRPAPGPVFNPANPRTHHATTGPEIFRSLEGDIDAFVVGVGTGGTLTGAGGFLKSHIGKLKIFAVEPAQSPVLAGGEPGPHPIQGIGAGFIPKVLNTGLIDKIIAVQGEDAFQTARELASRHGVPPHFFRRRRRAALRVAGTGSGKGGDHCPDTGERYLSTPCMAKEEMN